MKRKWEKKNENPKKTTTSRRILRLNYSPFDSCQRRWTFFAFLLFDFGVHFATLCKWFLFLYVCVYDVGRSTGERKKKWSARESEKKTERIFQKRIRFVAIEWNKRIVIRQLPMFIFLSLTFFPSWYFVRRVFIIRFGGGIHAFTSTTHQSQLIKCRT